MKNFLDALKVSQSRERRNTQNWSKFVDSKFQMNFQILPTLTFRCGFLDLRIL